MELLPYMYEINAKNTTRFFLRHTKEMPIKLSLNISENNDINVYTLQRNSRINTVYTLNCR